ncbi:MAG: hypothetical protein J2P55_10170, partial [Rhizobiales bacterium]|nr:hypothetical protein [Hyphomicrobiales bacterium]
KSGKTHCKRQNGKMFADRSHDRFLPQRRFSLRARQTRFSEARSITSDSVMLRCTLEAWPAAAISVVALVSDLVPPYGGNQIKRRIKCYRIHHDPVRGRLSLAEINRNGVPRGLAGRCDRLDCRPNATRQGQKWLPT